jgi:protein kinase C substrate 80K-H
LVVVLSLLSIVTSAAVDAANTASTSADPSSSNNNNNNNNKNNNVVDEIRCVTGWGIPPVSSDDATRMTVIPTAHINDGYCDCIYTGLDEPLTSACAGILPVVTDTATKRKADEIRFQCPQQPTLRLHLSRVNDGICDCCDGADEIKTVMTTTMTATTDVASTTTNNSNSTTNTTNPCPDQCATVLAAFRAEQKRRQTQFTKGREVRTQMITSYQTMINTTRTKIKQLTHDITERKKTLQDKYRRSLTAKQLHYTNIHIQRIYHNIYLLTGLPHDRDRYTKFVWTMLHDLSIEELETLIVSTCQLAGEVDRLQSSTSTSSTTTTSHNTCVPLRLAAIEIGDMFVTSKDNDQMELRRLSQDEKYSEEDDGIMAVRLANIYDYNSQYPHHPIFMEEEYKKYIVQLDNGFRKSSKTKRSGDNYDEEDYEDEEYYEEDEYDDEHDDEDSTTKKIYIPKTIYEDPLPSEPERRTKYETLVQNSVLSRSRQRYIQQAQKLQKFIQDQLTILEQEQEKSPKPPPDEELVLDDEMAPEPIDHSTEIEQLRHLIKELQQRINHIERGYTYGQSAYYILSSITEETMTFRFEPQFIFGAPEKNMKPSVNDAKLFHQQYLQKLFLLTLYYSQLSVVQVYEILHASLSSPSILDNATETENSTTNEEQQCTVPYAHLCPPTSTLNKSSMSVPKLIFEAMETFCHTLSMDGPGTSASAETSTCAAVDVIPESIPVGYFGYYPIVPREENDVMTTLLDPLGYHAKYCTDDEIHTKREMRSIQETVTQYQINIGSMEQTLAEMKESIKTNDVNKNRHDDADDDDDNENDDRMIALPKYGLDGELHSIQDQCFDFTQGKYQYEICLFQGSTQKDIDNTNGDSTSLGRWSGTYMERVVENNVEYYERIWKWENGAQCWNGPQRSITAHVNQCGPITRIVSANEPDTCRYVVEVESPIACDTIYQQRYGLE